MTMWWENDFVHTKNRRLYLGRRSAEAIAGQAGTPVLVYSRSRILANYDRLHRSFSKATGLETRICYAMKANPHRGILELLKQRGGWVDAVSPGEVEEARRAGFPAGRILFTGTSVSTGDLRRAFRHRGVTVNIDALEQLELMKDLRASEFPGHRIRVSVRLNPGVGRGFNPRVVTAGARSADGTPIKFGLEENKILSAFERAASSGFIPVALHQHLGSGWVAEDYGAVRTAVDKMLEVARKLERSGFRLEFLDFGGGFGPRYAKTQSLFPVEKYASYIGRRIAGSGLALAAVAVEPGKYLVADAGVLLLGVEYLKESYGHLFACVNSGTFNSLPRPAIYPQAFHQIVNCRVVRTREMRPITVAGNLCETGDVFGREILMPVPRRGDVLAVLCAGAYGRSMASRFNLREIPGEIIV